MTNSAVYMDCNATTPIEEEVLEAMTRYFRVEYGNAGSRTHLYGSVAGQAVRVAREQIRDGCECVMGERRVHQRATESNNLAILGWQVTP